MVYESGRPFGQPALVSDQAPTGLDPSGFDQAQGLSGQILGARNCDDEVAKIMDELSKLQTLLTLQMRNGPVWISAADLVQRARCLIVERCFVRSSPSMLLEEAREGLRVFGEAADCLDESDKDRSNIWESPAAMEITVGDLRRAHAVAAKLGAKISPDIGDEKRG